MTIASKPHITFLWRIFLRLGSRSSVKDTVVAIKTSKGLRNSRGISKASAWWVFLITQGKYWAIHTYTMGEKGGNFKTRKLFNYPESFLYWLYSSKWQNWKYLTEIDKWIQILSSFNGMRNFSIWGKYLQNKKLRFLTKNPTKVYIDLNRELSKTNKATKATKVIEAIKAIKTSKAIKVIKAVKLSLNTISKMIHRWIHHSLNMS